MNTHENELQVIKSAQIMHKSDMDSTDAMINYLDAEGLFVTPGSDYFPMVADKTLLPKLMVDHDTRHNTPSSTLPTPPASPRRSGSQRNTISFTLPSDEEFLANYSSFPHDASSMEVLPSPPASRSPSRATTPKRESHREAILRSWPHPLSRFVCNDGELFISVMGRAVSDLSSAGPICSVDHLVQLGVLTTWLMVRSKELQHRGQQLTRIPGDGRKVGPAIRMGWQARQAFTEAIRSVDVDVIEDVVYRLENAYLEIEPVWFPAEMDVPDVDLSDSAAEESDDSWQADDVNWDELHLDEGSSVHESWKDEGEDEEWHDVETYGRVAGPSSFDLPIRSAVDNKENVPPPGWSSPARVVHRDGQMELDSNEVLQEISNLMY